jgi:hypothetical protein
MIGIEGSGGIIQPTRGIIRRGGIISAPDQIVKSYPLTSSLPSGATFTRASIGTRTNISGTIVTETTDVARFDYDPITHAPLGILIETARTNLALRSQEVNASNGQWSALNLTYGATVTSPDGTANATDMREANTGYPSYQILTCPAVTVANAATATRVRIYLKMSGYRYVANIVDDGHSGSSVTSVIDLQNGVLVSSVFGGGSSGWSLQNTTLTSVGNGWYQLDVNFTVALFENNVRNRVITMSDVATYPHAGDVTKGFYVWGYDVAHQLTTDGGTYIPTTTATVTRAVDVLTLPIPDGIWDITTTDATGSTTTRKSVVSGYTVVPRSGKTRVTSIRAVFIATYSGFDSDAKTWLHANQIIDLTGRRAVNATFAAIKAEGTLTFADIAFAGFAPGRNLDTGTTVKTAGGWTAALIDGALSSSSLMRTRDLYGLYCNDGATGGTMTRIDFAAVPLGSTYAVGVLASPKGNPNVDRGLFAVAGNTASFKQLSSAGLKLNADSDSSFTRGLRLGRVNRLAFIQEASSVGRALGELGYNRTTSLNVTGTNTVYLGSQGIAGSGANVTEGGVPAVILEAAFWMKNPTPSKVATLGTILRDNLCVAPTATVEGFLFTGQSQASPTAAGMLDQIIAVDSTYGRNFLQQQYQHVNQPIAQWVGAGAPYARTNFYPTDISAGGNWTTLLAQETRTARTSGLFWFQGEADAGYSQGLSDGAAEAVAALYAAKLQAFVDFIRIDYPALPIVIFQIDWETVASHTLTASEIARLATIRAAQATVAANNTKIALIDTRGMARDPADGVHLTNAGILAAMQAGWTAMKALL